MVFDCVIGYLRVNRDFLFLWYMSETQEFKQQEKKTWRLNDVQYLRVRPLVQPVNHQNLVYHHMKSIDDKRKHGHHSSPHCCCAVCQLSCDSEAQCCRISAKDDQSCDAEVHSNITTRVPSLILVLLNIWMYKAIKLIMIDRDIGNLFCSINKNTSLRIPSHQELLNN